MSHQLWSTLIKYSVSPNQIYFLDCCSNSIIPSGIINQEAEKLVCISKGLIDMECKLTNLGVAVLNDFETYLVKKKKIITKSVLGEDFLEKVKEYREAFPSKRLPSGELARQSVQELKDKFIWFFKTYPEYDWDLVLDATDAYNIMFEKKGYLYMASSSYFIKKTSVTKEVTSKLADFCQEILDNPKILNNIK